MKSKSSRVEKRLSLPAEPNVSVPAKERMRVEYRTETAALLADQIRRYTAGKSSSVRESTASQILGSIRYSMNAYTAELKTREDIQRALRVIGVRGIYREGLKIVRACLEDSKSRFENIVRDRLKVPLAPYNDMLDTEMPEFLNSYDAEFNAQETICGIDYPLAFDDKPASGIFFCNRYLKNLQTETNFCRAFSEQSVLRVLREYRRKFGIDPFEMPLNLFTILFDQSVFAELAGNPEDRLTVTAEQSQRLTESLSGISGPELRERIAAAGRRTAARLHLQDPVLPAYLRRARTRLAERAVRANRYGNIRNLILTHGEISDAGGDVFTDGDRMDDWKFAALADQIGECENTDEKIRLISESIRSSKDFMDLLEADCLYGDEFQALYRSLGETELAVLGKLLFGDEIRQGSPRLTDVLTERRFKNTEPDWKREYRDFLRTLPPERISALERRMNRLVLRTDAEEP